MKIDMKLSVQRYFQMLRAEGSNGDKDASKPGKVRKGFMGCYCFTCSITGTVSKMWADM